MKQIIRNAFDERYEIRLANEDDVDDRMQFIRLYWKKNHIMGNDKAYFLFEFKDEDNINFIIAKDKKTNLIEAILGYLKASKNKDKLDIWGSIWKVNEYHDNMKLLGVELEKRLEVLSGCRYHNGIGINNKTALPLMRLFLKHKTDKMNHYYIVNDKIENYEIAVIDRKTPLIKKGIRDNIKKIYNFDEIIRSIDIDENSNIPYKDSWYYKKKYFNNPKRKYITYGIESEEKKGMLDAFFITRECEYNNRKVLRILDYFGNRKKIVKAHDFFVDLLYQMNYEYIDFYNYGYEEEYLIEAGFNKRVDGDTNIIPNYFEPFVRQNIEIWIHFEVNNVLIFKGDGDQDRANI